MGTRLWGRCQVTFGRYGAYGNSYGNPTGILREDPAHYAAFRDLHAIDIMTVI
jgi:hypothetical protein